MVVSFKNITLTSIAILSVCSFAGGFDNSYYPDSIFFGESRIEGSVAWTELNVSGNLTSSGVTKKSNDIYVRKVSPVGSARYLFNPKIGCSIQTQKPYRANTRYNTGFFPGMPTHSTLETQLDTIGCTYAVAVNEDSKVQVIAGINRLNGTGGFGSDATTDPTAVTTSNVNSLKFKEGYFGMFGLGYEIPEYYLRFSAMYYPEYSNSASGSGSYVINGVDQVTTPADTPKMVISPQRLHLYAQSGIYPKWLILAGYIYAQWSKVPTLTVNFSSATWAAAGLPTSTTQYLFGNDAHYFYGGVAHLLTKAIKLNAVLFYEPSRDNPVDSMRTPSRGGVFSSMFGSSYDYNSHVTLGMRYSFLTAASTKVAYTTSAGTSISGDFPTSYGHKFQMYGEYKL